MKKSNLRRKEFLPYEEVRNNALLLASRIETEFGVPDVIYVSLRGGAAMGNVISEYFKLRPAGKTVFYAAVVARSYTDIGVRENVVVDGWTWPPEKLSPTEKILLVDDIFDTGRTINHLVQLMRARGLPRKRIGVVVHDYKIRLYEKEKPAIKPDFFVRKHEIASPDEDFWIHYLSHELKSLSPEEIEHYYLAGCPQLKEVFKRLKKDGGRK